MEDVHWMGAGLVQKERRRSWPRQRAGAAAPVQVEIRPGLPSTRLRRWILWRRVLRHRAVSVQAKALHRTLRGALEQ